MTRVLATLCAGLFLGAAAAADYTPPPEFTARYGLTKGPLTVAEAHLAFTRPAPDRYRYEMHTHAVGMARMFYKGEIHEFSEGRIVADGFRPERYRYERRGDSRARTAELHFDWDRGEVVNDIADRPWRLEIPPDTIDRVISPLQLMHDLSVHGNNGSRTYRIADGGQLKVYEVRFEGEETVDTPAGRFHAIKVVRVSDDGEREFRLWAAPELAYMPVRIEQWESGNGTFTLNLRDLEGIDLDEARQPGRGPMPRPESMR